LTAGSSEASRLVRMMTPTGSFAEDNAVDSADQRVYAGAILVVHLSCFARLRQSAGVTGSAKLTQVAT
jgi:hypothetical protein